MTGEQIYLTGALHTTQHTLSYFQKLLPQTHEIRLAEEYLIYVINEIQGKLCGPTAELHSEMEAKAVIAKISRR